MYMYMWIVQHSTDSVGLAQAPPMTRVVGKHYREGSIVYVLLYIAVYERGFHRVCTIVYCCI